MDNYSLVRLFRNYAPYVRSYKLQVSIMIGLSMLMVMQRMWIPYILRDLSLLFSAKPLGGLQPVIVQIALLGFANIAGVLAGVLRDRINIAFQLAVMRQLDQDVFAWIHGHSMGFFQDNFAGALVKKAGRYVSAFEHIADKISFFLLPFCLELLLTIGILFSIHAAFGLLMTVYFVLYLGVILHGLQKKAPLDLAATQAQTTLSGVLADTIANALNLKVFAGMHREKHHFGEVVDKANEASEELWLMNLHFHVRQDAVMVTFTVLLYLLYGLMAYEGMLAPTQVILLFGVDSIIRGRMMDLGWQLRHLYEEAAHAMEMVSILDTPHDIRDVQGATTLSVPRGDIRIEGVELWHEDHRIFHDFSLHIRAGEKVGLVGTSGAGKSTLMRILLRLVDVQEGRVLIDGQDISMVTQDSLHANIAYVPQEPSLFHRTLFENIAYGKPEATLEEVQHAARLAHAHEFIMQRPDGYNTYVGERGVKLSGGERQRVAIARAILKDAPIIFLDEATSALDSESEHHIQQALQNLIRGKTVVAIAHRLSTVMEMRILMMEKGQILEEGTHNELLARPSGKYAALWQRQSGSFVPVA